MAIGVIAIVSAITVTGLRSTVQSGRSVQQLADLRSCGQLLLAWTSEHQDAFLNGGVPARPDLSPTIYLEGPNGQLIQVDYLGQWYAWIQLIRIWAGEHVPNSGGVYYALGCITDSTLWVDDPPPWTRYPAYDAWRVIRTAETQFPSQKAMMFRGATGAVGEVGNGLFPMFFVDGSAEVVQAERIGPMSQGFYGGGPADPPMPGRDTLHGIQGRDVAR